MSTRGVALLMAVAVIAVLGVISLTGITLARGEREAGLKALAEVQARGAAQAALADAMTGWPRALTPLVPGAEVTLRTVLLPGLASAQAVVRSTGGPVFALRATGVRTDQGGAPLASVTIELLVRLDSLAPDSLIHPRKYPLGWRVVP